MSDFNNYDPARVLVAFAGIPITGFAEGTFISIERNSEAFTTVVGSTGDVTRVRSRDKSGVVTLTLMAGSPTNDLLAAKLVLDELSGLGFGPFLCKDANGTTIIQAAFAWIEKFPNVEFGNEGSNREWKIACSDLTVFVGGNLL